MRPIKFRAWNGEQMISPDYVTRDGRAHWKEHSIPESTDKVMQFTGLHDKNGKEIYEGDIVQWREDLPRAEVKFGTLIEHCDNDERTGWIAVDCFVDKECKVIGNIYENPELLK